MGDIQTRLSNSLQDFRALSRQTQEDNYIYANPAWQVQSGNVFASWQQIRTDVQRIIPPARYKESHKIYGSALDHFVIASNHYTLAISRGDQAEWDRGNEEYQLANRLLDEYYKAFPSAK